MSHFWDQLPAILLAIASIITALKGWQKTVEHKRKKDMHPEEESP